MTKITLFRDHGRLVGFEAKGHAGYAKHGEDIVCAAISALTQGAVIGLRESANITAATEIKDGYIYCMLPEDISQTEAHDAELILDTMARSIRSIAETNGDYIKMTDREV